MIVAVLPLTAQEYRVFGDIRLQSQFLDTPGGQSDNSLTSGLRIEATHHLDYDQFSFIARHEVDADGAGNLSQTIHEAYVNFHATDRISLNVGKQRLAWGRGLSYFPSDSLHPEHTRTDTEGFTGLSVSLTPGSSVQCAGAVDFTGPLTEADANEDFYKSLKYALYTSWFTGNADLALSAVYRRDRTLRPALGMSVDLKGFILTGEGAVEYYSQSSSVETVPGNPGLYHTPRLLTSASLSRSFFPAAVPDLSVMFAAEYQYREHQYVFSLFSVALDRQFSVELSSLVNVRDLSSSSSAEVKLLRFPSMDISAAGTLLAGKTGSEFGDLKTAAGDYSVTVRSTIYF